jgi:hypothetical protein
VLAHLKNNLVGFLTLLCSVQDSFLKILTHIDAIISIHHRLVNTVYMISTKQNLGILWTNINMFLQIYDKNTEKKTLFPLSTDSVVCQMHANKKKCCKHSATTGKI